ncbi:hypothetical protein I5G63_gp084 [Mycobacterium phage Imvubu]|uniref:Uncharacterized protein n=1 Tax=Mycobacterium phage Imvubu TaxID=2686233 RepID=A0A6B9LIZ1_9CAUD|nr:hypothetical protein I5G63_gp084 [Mycobacterium phage Imvubu]QHB37824.1 hypothetical protein PBI_IMVUBU_84 [Mycobacterium phage Imvubu]
MRADRRTFSSRYGYGDEGRHWTGTSREPAHQRAKHRAPRHDMELMFAERNITARDGYTTVTGPIPWRRFTRDGEVLLFHMRIPRPVSHWNYAGRHRRPEQGARRQYPGGMVYVGHFTGDVYRMQPEPGTCATNLTRPGRR